MTMTCFEWLLKTEAAMAVHQRTYPGDGRWREGIREQANDLPHYWYVRLWHHAQAVLEGRATRFCDPSDER